VEETLYNLAFERSVLSSIIFDPAQFDDIEVVLKTDDFYLVAHQEIYRSMLSLATRDLPIDEEFLKKELSGRNKFDERVMVEILTANPIANISAYMQEIKDKALKRHLLSFTTDIKRVTLEEDLNAVDIVDMVEKKLYEITQSSQATDFKDAPRVTTDTRAYIEEMKARGDSVLVGVDTGYAELNQKTTGFGKGDLVIIAARPAMGKTSFALNMVQNLINKGKGVAFFSLEMPAEQLMLRLLSVQTSIQLQRLRVGDINQDESKRLNDAMDKMNNSKLFIDDHGSVNINQLRSKLRKLKSRHPEIELAVIDYLQIMSGTGGKDRHLEVSEISRGLKMLARELEIPIVALSQLNRSLESRSDKRPMLSDIRESGAIEQDADIILFVYRNDVYLYAEEKERAKKALEDGKPYENKFQEKEEEDAEIIIGKQRNGPTGIINLIFQKKFTRFIDRPAYGSAQIIYETIDMKPAKMDIDDLPMSMPII
jgi:replicative DNA helicase